MGRGAVVRAQEAHAGARLVHLGQHAAHQIAQLRRLRLRSRATSVRPTRRMPSGCSAQVVQQHSRPAWQGHSKWRIL